MKRWQGLQVLYPLLNREARMPHYEFFCHNCKKFFSKVLSLTDYEEGQVMCPNCGSKDVEQRWSPFTMIASKKSA
jgi:putative FmdB family regulatory protein